MALMAIVELHNCGKDVHDYTVSVVAHTYKILLMKDWLTSTKEFTSQTNQ